MTKTLKFEQLESRTVLSCNCACMPTDTTADADPTTPAVAEIARPTVAETTAVTTGVSRAVDPVTRQRLPLGYTTFSDGTPVLVTERSVIALDPLTKRAFTPANFPGGVSVRGGPPIFPSGSDPSLVAALGGSVAAPGAGLPTNPQVTAPTARDFTGGVLEAGPAVAPRTVSPNGGYPLQGTGAGTQRTTFLLSSVTDLEATVKKLSPVGGSNFVRQTLLPRHDRQPDFGGQRPVTDGPPSPRLTWRENGVIVNRNGSVEQQAIDWGLPTLRSMLGHQYPIMENLEWIDLQLNGPVVY